MLAPSQPANAMVATSIINKRWRQVDSQRSRPLLINVCQHTEGELMIQSTRAGLRRCHLAFAVANFLLNRRFVTATVGNCSDCWKLRRVARNMTENVLSILIVMFSVQLQQTEISDRKLFIFQHGSTEVKNKQLSL